MHRLRSLVLWAFAVSWTLLVLGTAVLASLLTLGLLRHRLINLVAPVWGHPILWVAGVRLDVRGAEHLRGSGPRIMTFNHQTILEIPAVAAMNPPGFSPLGKIQFKYMPVLGQAWWALGGHFVDRGHRARALESLRRLAEDMRAHDLLAVVAPEGTRSRDGRLQPFKMGAFHLARQVGAPVVPVVFHDGYDLCRPDTLWIRPGTLHVDVHPPIDTSGWTAEGLKDEARALHDRYAAWLAAGPLPRG